MDEIGVHGSFVWLDFFFSFQGDRGLNAQNGRVLFVITKRFLR